MKPSKNKTIMKTTFNIIVTVGCFCTMFFIKSCISKTSVEKDQLKVPSQAISYSQANILEDEFIKTRANILNDTLGFEDSREFLFSLDSLKQYIAYFEREAKTQGYKDLGIRIYFGAYPESKKYPDPGKATVFLVPTGNKIQSQGSFNPFLAVYETGDDNIESISSLNYGHAGRPPKKIEE